MRPPNKQPEAFVPPASGSAEALIQSEARFHALFEHSHDAIGVSTDGRHVFVNAAYAAMYGFPDAQALVGTPVLDRVPPPEREALQRRIVRRAAGLEEPDSYVVRGLRADGTEFDMENRVTQLDWGGKKFTLVIQRDVTAHRQSAEALRESDARNNAVLEAALDCIITIDEAGRVVEWNPAAERTFGYPREEALGRVLAEMIIPQSLRGAHKGGIAHFLATGEGPVLGRRIEVPALRRDGTEFPAELTAIPIRLSGRVLFTAYVRDITERKRAEAELRARAEREAMVSRIGQAILSSLDPEKIQTAATSELGRALAADRCLFIVYDYARGVASVGQNWRRPDLPSLVGEYPLEEFARLGQALFSASGPGQVPDIHGASLPEDIISALERMHVRSLLGVPLLDERQVTAALAVAMADTPRVWTSEEVALTVAVAGQTRVAAENARLHRAAQEAAEREREAAVRQRAFLRDVLASVTDGRLILCQSARDLPTLLPPLSAPIALSLQGGLHDLRNATRDACRAVQMAEERCLDIVTAASEAGMNAIVHAGEGEGWVFADADRGVVQVQVIDHGQGIALEDLPHATLRKGYSSAGTLGHGMKMMLQTADRVFLLTGSTGTTVVIEQHRVTAPSGL